MKNVFPEQRSCLTPIKVIHAIQTSSLTAPSNYLIQCWLLIDMILRKTCHCNPIPEEMLQNDSNLDVCQKSYSAVPL